VAVEVNHEKWWNQGVQCPKTSKEKCEIKPAVKERRGKI
jgi:hypothetical protein